MKRRFKVWQEREAPQEKRVGGRARVRKPVNEKPAGLIGLGRTLGNRVFGRLIQAKLSVSRPGDPLEREADQVADAVMRMPLTPDLSMPVAPVHAPTSPSGQEVQRDVQESQEDVEDEQENEERVQLKAGGAEPPSVPRGTQSYINRLSGRGTPLPSGVRRFMEPRFGMNFSSVRLHTDGDAHQSAKALNARAYTLAPHIVFGVGHFAPDSESGQRLIAHELAHVVQQSGGAMSPMGTIAPMRVPHIMRNGPEHGGGEGGGQGRATPATHTEQEFEQRRSWFNAYGRMLREPPDAVIRYWEWYREHQNSEELFAIDPPDLWGRSLRGPPAPEPTPRERRIREYIDFMQQRLRDIEGMEGEYRRQETEALRRFQDWFDRNRDGGIILRRDPGTVYGELAAGVMIEDIDRETRQRVERERAERESAQLVDRTIAKYEQFLNMALQLRGYSARRFPYTIPVPSEGRDILVTGHPAHQAVLNDLADALMQWAGDHMHDPSFATRAVTPAGVLSDLLGTGYSERLTRAARVPLESESIDRNEIIASHALAAFGETVLTGLAVIAVIGLLVGAEIITAGQATWLLVGIAGYGGISSYVSRRDEIEQSGYDVPIPETVVHSVGDVAGASQLIEGMTGEQLGTGRRLSSLERSGQLGTGAGGVTLLLTGSRAYRQGQLSGQRWLLRQRGARPRGPGGAQAGQNLPEVNMPPRPVPNPRPGPVERAARAALPEELRVGFDRWMEAIRGGERPGDPERILGRMTPERIEHVSRQNTDAYQQLVGEAQRAQRIRDRAFDDPLNPQLQHVEQVGDNVTLRYENTRPLPHEIAQARDIAQLTGEPVQVFGDTVRGVDYPGIDGTIGSPPRPLSLKAIQGEGNAGYVRLRASHAYEAAHTQGYSHVEVHIHIRDSTLAEIRPVWETPPRNLPEVPGPAFDEAGTISRIVIHGSDGIMVVEPPLAGPALPGVPVAPGSEQEQEQGE